MNDIMKVLGEKVLSGGGKIFIDLALSNGSKLGEKVIKTAPVGAVLGIATGALSTIIFSSYELARENDIIDNDAI